MKTIWNRIETWLEKNLPKMREGLMPGASQEQIQELEKLVDVTLPEDFRESLRIHDGQNGLASPLLDEWQLFQIKYMMSDWQCMKELFDQGKLEGPVQTEGTVKAQWWNPRWLEVATNGAGDLICLDFDPASGGEVGQVIIFWHVHGERKVLAPSFQAWLADFAADLEQGKYAVEGEELRKKE